ncbi:cytochrome c-type biogenesis protein [Paraburkholderia dilworthii]|uniref:cytochrome c-type biogenesis protein n=1 Tax=Paraburkholderia dilworthii TaxID=948106 RepID=UPI00040434AD|nr:cytochrome c-type biogenesis protein [Paraburkholderia dilworthii]
MTSGLYLLVGKLAAALMLAVSMTCAMAQPADDALYNARVRHLADSFRCLVCQNQSLADSNAELAADLRNQIRDQISKGASDEQIQAYMVHRYGDFVLYRPPVKAVTWALWFGPFITLVAGAAALALSIRHARNVRPRILSPDERRHANALLVDRKEDTGR